MHIHPFAWLSLLCPFRLSASSALQEPFRRLSSGDSFSSTASSPQVLARPFDRTGFDVAEGLHSPQSGRLRWIPRRTHVMPQAGQVGTRNNPPSLYPPVPIYWAPGLSQFWYIC